MKYLDKNLSIKERQEDYKKVMDKKMNPISESDFNPEIFEPLGDDMAQIANRQRVIPPKELNIHELKPKEIRNGQMIGMYESKQDLYLIFAHRCNEMQQEIDLLKKEINLLKNK